MKTTVYVEVTYDAKALKPLQVANYVEGLINLGYLALEDNPELYPGSEDLDEYLEIGEVSIVEGNGAEP